MFGKDWDVSNALLPQEVREVNCEYGGVFHIMCKSWGLELVAKDAQGKWKKVEENNQNISCKPRKCDTLELPFGKPRSKPDMNLAKQEFACPVWGPTSAHCDKQGNWTVNDVSDWPCQTCFGSHLQQGKKG